MSRDPLPDRITRLADGFMTSRVLLSAVDLGLFTELAKHSMDEERLRKRLKLNRRGARDFFDALTSLGLLRHRNGIYSNTKETGFYLDKSRPTYIGGLLEMDSGHLYSSWASLTKALRTGNPIGLKRRKELFDTRYKDPEGLRSFLNAMTGISMAPARIMAKKFPWSDYESFFDIGTARGGVPVQIALVHKHLTGGGFDLPLIKPIFEEYVRSFGLENRVRFVSGDFFKDPFPKADVLIMGHILHDWNWKKKKFLIKKAFSSLRKNGAFIAYESILDDKRMSNTAGLIASLNMLVETQGGFEYTFEECFKWMREAGFRRTYSEHLIGPKSMVVAIK